MIPPVNVKSNHLVTYNEKIPDALKSINHPYVVSPFYMLLDDSCSFDTGYHVNREGVKQNTKHLIKILRSELEN